MHIMAPLIFHRSLLRASRAVSHPNGRRSTIYSVWRRSFADFAAGDMTLPLKGYKVLDMTRVLAGVRSPLNVTSEAY
jgi:succinate---hydroxymethylglutarate CoA-transferase